MSDYWNREAELAQGETFADRCKRLEARTRKLEQAVEIARKGLENTRAQRDRLEARLKDAAANANLEGFYYVEDGPDA